MTRSRHQRHSFLARVKELLFGTSHADRPQMKRRLKFEGLEGRQLMAADVGLISGHVFRDTSGDGKWQAAEAGISQATVQLWRDNGDGVFNTASDMQVSSQATNASGAYSFGTLTLGDYFLRRPAQTLTSGTNPGIQLSERASSLIHISALKTVIDNFNAPTSQTAAFDTTNDNTPATSVASGLSNSDTIGGEREIITNFTGDAEGPGILASARVATINVGGTPAGLLLLDATSSAKGTYTLVYDGADGNTSTTPNLAPGLGGKNLTAGGADHLRINLNSLDLPGAVVRVTVYTDATHYSTGTVTLTPRVVNGVSQNGGIVDYRFNFNGSGTGGFALGTGASGKANFTSVRAVVMSIDVPSDVDARLEMLGAYGAANATVDLAANELDVSVDKAVDNAAPIVGTNVNYTLTVSNALTLANGKASTQASGVALSDTLFTSLVSSGKLTYVSDSSGGGAFNTTTGMWTVGTLNPGQSKSIIITLRVNAGAMPSATNTLQLVSLDQLDVDIDDWRDTEIIRPKHVDIVVNKSVNNNHPDHNDAVIFTITAQNLGSANAQNVKVSDVFSSLDDFTINAITPSIGTYDAATGVWSIGGLSAGQSVTLTISGVADGCDPFTNTATFLSIGGGAVDTNAGNNTSSVTVTPQQADVGVSKAVTVNPTPSQANPNVSFQIVVSNTGPDAATGVIVADQMPAGLTFVSASSSDFNAATGNWNVGTIVVGATKTLMIQARLNAGITSAIISNTARVTDLDQCDENQANDSSTVSVSPQSIDLSVTKTVNTTTPNYQQNVVFTINVTNSGPNAATNVTLQDKLPSGLAYVNSATTQGNYVDSTGVWTVGTINVGQTITLSVTAKVNSFVSRTNTVEVSAADQTDIDSTPNNGVAGEDDIASVTVNPQLIDLNVTKTVNNSTPNLNGNVVFTITVTNIGPNVATGVSLFDAMSGGLSYLSSSATQGSLDPTTHIWTVGTIGVGQTFSLNITAKATSPDPQMNTAEVITADQHDIDSTPNNGRGGEDDIASVVVQPQAIDLNVTKTVNNSVPTVGGQVVFTVSVTNSGPNTATGVSLFDVMSAGLGFVSASATRGFFNPLTHIWTVGAIGVGETYVMTVTATVNSLVLQMNTAEVFTADQTDLDSTPNNGRAGEDDIASAAVQPQPAIRLADPDPPSKRRFLSR